MSRGRPPSEEERYARLALSCVAEAGDPKLAAAIALAGPVAVWQTIRSQPDNSAWTARVSAFDPQAVLDATVAAGARYVVPGDDEWPASLGDLTRAAVVKNRGGPPTGLWLRGARLLPQVLAARPVAVVGSRSSTAYGQRVAADLAAELSAAGHPVISGGAFGIDAAAHRGALTGAGGTVAVLACGVDQAYPQAHHTLFEEIAETGLVVSELPLGEHPDRVRFLARNRIIAALACAVVVVEAASRSGARNTANWAFRCLRPVAAVPGPVTSAQSQGCHELIRETDATLVTDAVQVLQLVQNLGSAPELPGPPREQRFTDGWPAEKLAVYEVLPARGGVDASTVSLLSRQPIGTCLALLGELLCEGHARRTGDDRWRIDTVPGRVAAAAGRNPS